MNSRGRTTATLSLLVSFIVLISASQVRAANDGSIDSKAIRAAIEDMIETFGDEYPDGESYLAELDEIEQADDSQGKTERLALLQKRALLANPLLADRKILAIKRGGNQIATPSLNAYVTEDVPKNIGSQIVSIDPQSGQYAVLYDAQGKTIVDADLEFDAERLMFTAPGENGRWALHELDLKSNKLKQLSPNIDEIDFFDSCYLPDGDVIYGSNATFQGLPCESGRKQMALLYRMNPETKEIRQLTFEQDSDWCPTMMENGRVMYLRWEYTDTPHFFNRILFSMNPDGTNQTAVYGSNSYWPNSLFYAKPIPGDPARFVGTVSGHHVGRPGRLVLFDPRQGRHETEGVVQSIPGKDDVVENEVQDYLYQNRWPKFLQVDPLGTNEDDDAGRYFLVSANRGEGWGIWLVDVFDNMTPIAQEENAAFTDPILLTARKRPPVLSERTDPNQKDANVFIADVYFGPGLKDVPRGTIKSLRVFEYHFAYPFSGHNDVIGIESSWDVKRVLGTVPVEEDGSAAFRIPANVPIAVQPLDAEGRAVQLMRSWLVGKQGESVSCFGCHENANDISPTGQTIASRIDPHELTPWRGPTRGFDFLREVQPVLDKYCIGCHDGSAETREKLGVASNAVFPDFKDYSLETVEDGALRQIGPFYRSYMALRPYVETPGPESDLHLFNPGEYHASCSPLIQALRKGHHNVKLDADAYDALYTWIDLNAPCYGTWTEAHRHWQNKVLLDWMQIDHPKQMASIAKYRELRKLYSKEYADVDEDPEADAVDETLAYEAVEKFRAENPPVVPEPEARPMFKIRVPDDFNPLDSPKQAEALQYASASRKSASGKFVDVDTFLCDPEPLSVAAKRLSTIPDETPTQEAKYQKDVQQRLYFDGGATLDLVSIPAGDFYFGAKNESIAEYPRRPMRLDYGFLMSETEITNAVYALFDPSHDSGYVDELTKDHARAGIPANEPNQPVTRVGYDDAKRFCAWLDAKLREEGRLPDDLEVRLPTEVEWEYAARAGSNDALWYGGVDVDFSQYANLADQSLSKMRVGQGSVDYRRRGQCNDGVVAISEVGKKKPNAFGLYDMAGNVAEWTDSPWTDKGLAATNQPCPDEDTTALGRVDRVVRGGSWKDWPERATSSFRIPIAPYFRAADVGFRVVVAPKKK